MPDTANLCLMQKGDQLLWVGTCTSGCSIVLASSGGRAIHFCADDDQIRPLGRAAAGIQVCRTVGRSNKACLQAPCLSKCLPSGKECVTMCSCCKFSTSSFAQAGFRQLGRSSIAAVAWQLLAQQAGPCRHMHDIMTG